MPPPVPPRLTAILEAPDPGAREVAWEEFVREYSGIILHAVRNRSSSQDEAMDRYVFALEQLKAEGFKRLRTFSANGRGEFTTWLFVVVRRLGVDHHRREFGRLKTAPGSAASGSLEQAARHRLARFLAEEMDLDRIRDSHTPDPETAAFLEERRQALGQALDGLEPRDRLLVTLRFVDGLAVREIAQAMGFQSPFQVYRRLEKILSSLKDRLLSRGISEM